MSADPSRLPQPFIAAPRSGFHGHHSYPGGLAVHTAFNTRAARSLADNYAEIYQDSHELDRDLVIGAPLWHDWAKPLVFQWNADGIFRLPSEPGNGGNYEPAAEVRSRCCTWKELFVRNIFYRPLSVLSLAAVLAACNSTGGGQTNPVGSGGQGGKSTPDARPDTADTSTSSGGTGGTASTGGTKAGSGGTGAAGSSGQGGSSVPSETGGSGKVDSAEATGGRTGDASVDRGGDGSADRANGGAGGGGSGGSADTGSVVNPADGGGTPGKGCTPPTSYANLFVTVSGHTQAESDDKVAKAWSSLFAPKGSGTIYYDGPGADESYVEDIYNNDVRSEGMSYGMMVAVQLDHQTEFDRIWTWVKKHMANGTGEISWSCSTSGGKNSSGGAPDGEEYFATALIFAHNRWGDSTGPGKIAYATEAQWVLNVIRTKYFNSQYHLVKFVANSSNVDPSYVLPAFYEVWACFDTQNAEFWKEAATAGREYMHKAIDSNGVCPYQASFTGQQPQAANSDSLRCVVNMMMDWYLFGADTWQKDTYATKFAAYSNSHNSGAAQVSCNATLGFGLPASSGKAFVDKLWSTAVPSHNYWDGVLYMLGMVHVSGNFHIW